MIEIPEDELLDGRRAFYKTQQITGVPVATIGNAKLNVSWFGTALYADRGAFAFVKEGSLLDADPSAGREGYVGDYLKISVGTRFVIVYVVGGSPRISTDLAISRRAFQELALLPERIASAYAEVLDVG